jgi:polyisoprenoid-binding protein YceI
MVCAGCESEEDRDKHLRNEDFFDVEKYPTLTFKSTGVTRSGDSLSIAGNLTIKKVTKPRMTFGATTTINRLDYGVNYDNILVRDGIVLGEDVTINIKLALVQQ